MMKDDRQIKLDAFYGAAKRCLAALTAVAKSDGNVTQAELTDLERVLVGVHLAALNLPDARPGSGDQRGTAEFRESDPSLYDSLLKRFAFDDTYYTVEGGEFITRSLTADLWEIAIDLAAAVAAAEAGLPDPPLSWELRFDFESHWGRHLVDSTQRLHILRATI
ncbi:MAG TPA: DUF5063 domain-containing protein [Gaiellaceae bacterium]|nr:DUF5063 domain-containing protein [Gaiellaceae bacterium]